jgi:hypothetical protein
MCLISNLSGKTFKTPKQMDGFPKVIGRIELPTEQPVYYQCLCCSEYKPKSQFPFGIHGLNYCDDCEFDTYAAYDPMPQNTGNIEQCFQEDWIRAIEEDWAIDDL